MINKYMFEHHAPPPPPWNENCKNMQSVQYMGPSIANIGRNDPISYTMIVSGCLNPFLVISDFFDSYRTLATLCKLKKNPDLAFWMAFWANGHLKVPILGSKNRGNWSRKTFFSTFFVFLVNVSHF